MPYTVFWGLMIPFIGTATGAACVLFMQRKKSDFLHSALAGFAAGVMTAASVWSLLIPSIEQKADSGIFAFVPATLGFCAGMGLLPLADRMLARAGAKKDGEKTALLVPAVVLHNIPEGMAVGAVYAAILADRAKITVSEALMLSVGIAVQNIPEGAIISLPIACDGAKKSTALRKGVLSGVVEPIAGALTVLLSVWVVPILPYLLAFAAGAMFYVVIRELIPEISDGDASDLGVGMFTAGFALMMALDVALG